MTPDLLRTNASRSNDCSLVAPLLVFYSCEEASAEERARVEQHVAVCSDCAAAFAAELRLRQMLATLTQPADRLDSADALLAQCRSELAEVLDEGRDTAAVREAFARPGIFAKLILWCRMELTLHPALGAALFVLIGLSAGRILPVSAGGVDHAGLVPNMTVSATPRISDQELQNMSVSGIYVVPDESGRQNVEVHLRAMTPIEVKGGPDDSEIKRVLSVVIQNGQRFDSDLRLDSVEVLRSRTDDVDVRRLLCTASLHDPNPGVRLRALEALHGFVQDAAVRDALLDALVHDTNPGVRIEAINELRTLVDNGNAVNDPRVARVMRDLSEHDSNNYIRFQASNAVRRLAGGPLSEK
jgi:hypothetical protein